MHSTRSAPGKIILSGEYAVLCGHAGIAMPSTQSMHVRLEEGSAPLMIRWEGITGDDAWDTYALQVATLCGERGGATTGTLIIDNELPLGKGMGSSTALVIAATRCLLGPDCEEAARAIEDVVNPGHSGLDFATIWTASPTLFRKDVPPAHLDRAYPEAEAATLIDTGAPDQTTAELVAWVREREEVLRPHLDVIGACTERLIAGESLRSIIPEHHRAQVALGVVTPEAQKLIKLIEQEGGVAKVIGAGARSGGCGMVLALHAEPQTVLKIATQMGFETLQSAR